MACGPGSPELSNSYSDTPSNITQAKLYRYHGTMHIMITCRDAYGLHTTGAAPRARSEPPTTGNLPVRASAPERTRWTSSMVTATAESNILARMTSTGTQRRPRRSRVSTPTALWPYVSRNGQTQYLPPPADICETTAGLAPKASNGAAGAAAGRAQRSSHASRVPRIGGLADYVSACDFPTFVTTGIWS